MYSFPFHFLNLIDGMNVCVNGLLVRCLYKTIYSIYNIYYTYLSMSFVRAIRFVASLANEYLRMYMCTYAHKWDV